MAATSRKRLLDTGTRAPDFRLPRLEGGEAALSDLLAGGRVLLAFFKITCPVCQLTMPYLERIGAGGKLPIYGISQNDAEDTREFNRRFGVTFPELLDPEGSYPASNAYGISTVPTMYLIEPGGKITRVIEGWNKREMEWLGTQAGVEVIRREDSVPEWKAG